MTTLRRILLATAQEGPEIGPKDKAATAQAELVEKAIAEENTRQATEAKKRERPVGPPKNSGEDVLEQGENPIKRGRTEQVGQPGESKMTGQVEVLKNEDTGNVPQLQESPSKVPESSAAPIPQLPPLKKVKEEEEKAVDSAVPNLEQAPPQDQTPLPDGPPPAPPQEDVKPSGEVSKKRPRDAEINEDSNSDLLKALRPPPRNASKKYSSKLEDITAAQTEELAEGNDSNKNINTGSAVAPGAVEEAVTWVQCERCQKWRDLPTSTSNDLPQHWFCSMNTWEPFYATCEAPQKDTNEAEEGGQTLQEAKTSKTRKLARLDVDKASLGGSVQTNEGKTKGLSPASAGSGRQSSAGPEGKTGTGVRRGTKKGSGNAAKVSRKQGRAAAQAGKNGNLRPSIGNMMSNSIPKKKEWNWVLCETCQQWRKLPPEVDVNRLPEKWYCHMNEWDKQRASCSAPQEADDATVGAEAAGAVETKNAVVKLPEGVNLYGGQFFPLKGRKHAPTNYRELIVNHYRHFKHYDATANAFLNARYMNSSLFVPRGTLKGKGVRKSAYEKGLIPPIPTDISLSRRRNKGISQTAVQEHSTFRKIFNLSRVPSKQRNQGKSKKLSHVETSQENDDVEGTANPQKGNSDDGANPERALDFIKDDTPQLPRALLKLTKPWRRTGGWTGEENYYCN
uniref:CW-type domain-containing protein n=1 Tax=Mucochytrium quahogii TaxID=96639 RepID=A0A7S2WT05_9STRA|mmetsp:Transcript_9441/g.15427  ORF Transcript_9441/g.15427 Transcript_9441/m.15427 type:complete len:678 (+) Transcript_9441:359-2392(+)